MNKLRGLEGSYSPITLVLGFRRTGKSSLTQQQRTLARRHAS
ncbi:MAG: hypothetical protein RXQ00_09685 [Caldivirga sp.]